MKQEGVRDFRVTEVLSWDGVFIQDLPLIHFEQAAPTSSSDLNRFPSGWLRLSQHKESEYASQDTGPPKRAWHVYRLSARQREPLDFREAKAQQFGQGVYAAAYMWSSFHMYSIFLLLAAGCLHMQLTFPFTYFNILPPHAQRHHFVFPKIKKICLFRIEGNMLVTEYNETDQ